MSAFCNAFSVTELAVINWSVTFALLNNICECHYALQAHLLHNDMRIANMVDTVVALNCSLCCGCLSVDGSETTATTIASVAAALLSIRMSIFNR
jgi:hypothetical protein